MRCSDEVTHLEQLDALVKRRDDLGLRDAEPRARRDVDRAVGADGRVLAAEAAHGEAEWLGDGLGLGVSPSGLVPRHCTSLLV